MNETPRRSLAEVLIPAEPRTYPGMRWLNIGLRVAHLVGVAGCGAGFLFALDDALWVGYWYLATLTGVALCASFVSSTGAWLLQLRGWAIVAKVLVLVAGAQLPAWRGTAFVVAIAISGIIAHAPGKLRGWPRAVKTPASGLK